MDVSTRIERSPQWGTYINLAETKKDVYTGSGWKLAQFIDGRLVSFFDPLSVMAQDSPQEMANDALAAAMVWLGNTDGEKWLVMCSCYQLCEPRRITLTDASGLAYMARVFGEQFTEQSAL